MPRYDFQCPQGHVTEAVKGYEVAAISCPALVPVCLCNSSTCTFRDNDDGTHPGPDCRKPAQRVAVYREQTIIGDTVAKPRLGSSVKDKNGRWDLGIFQEASQELVHSEEKAGVKGPNLYKAGKQRARQMGANIG